MKVRPRLAGFTLLEVLVATMIMAIAVVTLLTALNGSMRNEARLTAHQRMAMLARTKMDELLVDHSLPLEAELQGRFDPSVAGGDEAGWKVAMSVFDAPPRAQAGAEILQRLGLHVWWRDGGRERTLDLEGFRRTRIPSPQL